MANLYNGKSEGFTQVSEGFVDYALEVGINRSFASVVDGLKTSQRRAIYAMNENKIYNLVRSSKAVSAGLVYHPHGDSALYDTMVRMTRSNGSVLPSLLDSQGNLGKSYSDSLPADIRYTYMCLSKEAKELLLQDMDGIDWKDTETDEGLEPVYLPARFPMALTASIQGMGVGIANKVPSFNFGEVLKLTKEYIKGGEKFNSQIIYPDFPNGGIVLADNSEMAKLMATGRAKIKSKARISVHKKDIFIEELPYNVMDGKVVGKIKALVRSSKKRKLDNGDPNPFFGKFPYISHEDDIIPTSGLDGFGIKIRCRKAADTEIVLRELARRGITQNYFTSNMLFTNGSRLMVTGVYGVIETWYQARKQVLTKKFNAQIDALNSEKVVLDYFLQLISNDEYKNKYLDLLTNTGLGEANEYLESIFEGISLDVCSWISKRRASAFLDGGKYAKRYQDVVGSIDLYNSYLADLATYIYDDLTDVENKFSNLYPRKTEITFKDYKFVKKEEEVVEDTSYCAYILYKSGNLLKTSSKEGYDSQEDVLMVIEGQANSILVGFDYVGNLIRVYGSELQNGTTYLPTYLGVAGLVDDYRILYLTVVDGSRKRLLYKDGRMSVLDTSEFLGKKQRKRFIRNGVPEDVSETLVEVFNEEDLGDYLYVADESGALQLGVVSWKDLSVKSRLAKTRAFTGSKSMNITQYGSCSLEECHNYFNFLESYEGRLRKVKEGDVTFDGSEFTLGRYV